MISSRAEITDLPQEIIFYIATMLNSDKDKLAFLASFRNWNMLKALFTYNKRVKYEKINDLWYMDMFTKCCINANIETRMYEKKLPYKMQELSVSNYKGNVNNLIKNNPNLSRLIIDRSCDINIFNKLSNQITHLYWNNNKPLIKNFLNNKLRVLHIDNYHHDTLWLPSNLRCLILGSNVKSSNKTKFTIKSNMLPDGIVTLVIVCNVIFDEYSIPSSLRKIIFTRKHIGLTKQMIFPSHVKCIIQ